ncbi:hypothetical protein K523DRAFT_353948 [Schizophyllum commune Tattone D]|nr:hypothetical protein K523DRAFT_353948 [Schizophyllum commune Tattone D]
MAERVAVAESAAADEGATVGATEEVATMAEGNMWTDSTTNATQQAQQRQGSEVLGNKKRKGKKRARDGLPRAEDTSAEVAGGARSAEVAEGAPKAEGESVNAGADTNKRTMKAKKDKSPAKEQAPRPTHFLSLSLATDPTLRARLIAFGDALLAASPPVAGLDKSIIIDPRRVHLTLGVMRLEEEEDSAPTGTAHADTEAQAIGDPPSSPPPPKKTISSALALLRSLAPQLAALGPARVDLERLGVLKTQKGGREANVLWVGPREADESEGREGAADSKGGEAAESASEGTEKSSLYAIADLVHQTFRREGYVTDTRPLKLHVTLLNTTHRKKPRRRLAFSYTDVLQSEAVKLLGAVLPGPAKAGDAEAPDAEVDMVKRAIADAEQVELDAEAQEQIEAGGDAIVPDAGARGEIARVVADEEVDAADGKSDVRVDVVEVDIPAHPASGAPSVGLNSHPTASSAHSTSSTARPSSAVPRHPIPISLGSYDVRAVHLCEMGSHGPDNEYVSIGCVEF